jgi:hypothetical protein
LNILKLFEKIFDLKFKKLSTKFPKKVENFFKRSTSLMKVHEYFSVISTFDEETAQGLGLCHDPDEWPLEEISHFGILTYDKKAKVEFNHESYPKFLIASILFKIIKSTKNVSNFHAALTVKVLTDEKFKITRIFLDKMLENFERKDLKLFDPINENFVDLIASDSTLSIINEENHVKLSELFLSNKI